MAKRPPKVPVVFYRTAAGREVVRDWLRALDESARNAIGQDLMRVQYRWPVGMPLCRAMGDGLWEVCSDLPGARIARLFFGVVGDRSWSCMASSRRRRRRRLRTLPWLGGANVNSKGCEDDMKKKVGKKPALSAAKLSTLDDFLKEEGKLEEFEAVAVKEVLAWQLGEAMKTHNISRKRLAERMKTSRSQVGRLLDPKDGNVTLATLQRAATIVGRKLRLELV